MQPIEGNSLRDPKRLLWAVTLGLDLDKLEEQWKVTKERLKKECVPKYEDIRKHEAQITIEVSRFERAREALKNRLSRSAPPKDMVTREKEKYEAFCKALDSEDRFDGNISFLSVNDSTIRDITKDMEFTLRIPNTPTDGSRNPSYSEGVSNLFSEADKIFTPVKIIEPVDRRGSSYKQYCMDGKAIKAIRALRAEYSGRLTQEDKNALKSADIRMESYSNAELNIGSHIDAQIAMIISHREALQAQAVKDAKLTNGEEELIFQHIKIYNSAIENGRPADQEKTMLLKAFEAIIADKILKAKEKPPEAGRPSSGR